MHFSQLLSSYLWDELREEVEVEGEDPCILATKRAFTSATTCFTWLSGCLASSTCLHLVTGQMDGHLVTYRVEGEQVEVVGLTATGLASTSTLHYLNLGGRSVLVVGERGGRVRCMEQEGEEGWRPSTWLWGEEDQLEVSRVLAMGSGVVLVKSNFCLFLPVGAGEEGLEVGQMIPLNCGFTRVVGAVVLEQGLLVATQKEQLLWRPEEGRRGVVVEEVEGWEHYLTCGLVASPNHCLLVTLQSISAFHDHLILREPGRLVAWTLHPREAVEGALAGGAMGPDLLEVARCLRGREDLPATFAPAPSPVHCRLDLWRCRALLGRKRGGGRAAEVARHCELVLRCQAAAELLAGTGDAEARQGAAAFLLSFSKEPAQREAAEAVGEVPSTWQCPLCPPSNPSPLPSTLSSLTCLQGHAWPRCVLTQGPVTSPSPLACRWCGAPALPHPAPPPCTLCRGPLAPSP